MTETLTNKDFWRLGVLGECPLPLNQPWTQYMYQVGILWIEESQVRLYKPEDREPLRNFSNLHEWEKALKQVSGFQDENITSIPQLKVIFQSLLKRAIEEEYADAVQSEKIEVLPINGEIATIDHYQYHAISDQMYQLVLKMTSSQGDLESVVASVERQPDIEEALQIIVSKTIPAQATPEDFVIKNPSPTIAARLIAQRKLGEIQLLVNECLSDLQLQTADPKADYK